VSGEGFRTQDLEAIQKMRVLAGKQNRDAPMVVADSIPGPARLQVRHLRLMLAIGSSGSITRAARSLNLSQSALSHQLIDLERDLGVSLFDRIGRRMVATAAGDRLLAAARSILPDMSDVETKIMAAPKTAQRRVRLTASCFTYYGWLAPALAGFDAKEPTGHVELVLEATRREFDALHDGDVDGAIISQVPPRGNFRSIDLFDDDLVAVMSPRHARAVPSKHASQSLRWKDLSDEVIFTHEIPDRDVDELRAALEDGKNNSAGGKPKSPSFKIRKTQLTESILELAKAGVGIGIMARNNLAPFWPDQRLVVAQPRPRVRRSYRMIWRKGNARELLMEQLANHIMSFISQRKS
jgi:LysR family transcriptional regulator for metE and metH